MFLYDEITVGHPGLLAFLQGLICMTRSSQCGEVHLKGVRCLWAQRGKSHCTSHQREDSAHWYLCDIIFFLSIKEKIPGLERTHTLLIKHGRITIFVRVKRNRTNMVILPCLINKACFCTTRLRLATQVFLSLQGLICMTRSSQCGEVQSTKRT